MHRHEPRGDGTIYIDCSLKNGDNYIYSITANLLPKQTSRNIELYQQLHEVTHCNLHWWWFPSSHWCKYASYSCSLTQPDCFLAMYARLLQLCNFCANTPVTVVVSHAQPDCFLATRDYYSCATFVDAHYIQQEHVCTAYTVALSNKILRLIIKDMEGILR